VTRGVIGAGHLAIRDLHRERLLLLLNAGWKFLVMGFLGPFQAVDGTIEAAGGKARSRLFLGFEGHRVTEWVVG